MEKPSDQPVQRLRQKLAAGLQHSKTTKLSKERRVQRKKKESATQGDPLWKLYLKAKARGKALKYASCCGAITIRGERADLSHHKTCQVPLSALIGKETCPDSQSLASRVEDAFKDSETGYPYLLIGSSHLEGKYDRLHYKMMKERKKHKETIARLEEELLLLKQSQKLSAQGEESTTHSSQGTQNHGKEHQEEPQTSGNQDEEKIKGGQEDN